MLIKAAIRAEAQAAFDAFRATGAVPVEADLLLPAGTLLDLYGEDIRATAYVTQDPDRGEMMLRPDFTVPVVQAHMSHGAEPARYCYMGEVFRQDAETPETLQVGYEVFDRQSPEEADAEVFALFRDALKGLPAQPVTGDIGILMAAVKGLETTPRRKSALLRHIWRPTRFRALLDRFSGRAPMSPARAALLQHLSTGVPADLIAQAGPVVGLRDVAEIAARAEALREDAQTPPIPAIAAAMLYDLLHLQAPARAALTHLQAIAPHLPSIAPAVDRFGRRLDALDRRGVDTQTLAFEASHGRAAMEYYDGFVFSFRHGAETLATGGRYDALTTVLGRGQSIPAVGGILRPHLMAELRSAP
ncbi:ATP phosphoribosyltransferase regulatory subunit [Rhodobacter sp. KR11]|uniref:ATP phosphoribosyltransferase regulatory subunit n=1 Tax=Rhodobacter sp. KR11 TaxID=2974588 RepID=UPI002223368E|nr:ATP phosphoribosyltransferase regulatory subunit [Rhodobacter sp. KR11]MCW1917474.1 ATP phosphoribosyltransferase regulatory subunit [Rhodobacter sp. KR11]